MHGRVARQCTEHTAVRVVKCAPKHTHSCSCASVRNYGSALDPTQNCALLCTDSFSSSSFTLSRWSLNSCGLAYAG